MTKRHRSLNDEESLPDLEPLSGSGSDDSHVSLDRIRSAKEIRQSRRSRTHDFELDQENPSSNPELGQDFSSEIPLEPFNLNDEREQGTFDEDGSYVQSREQAEELRDAWFESIQGTESADTIDKAKRSAEERDRFWSAVEAGETGPTEASQIYLYRIVRMLRPNETPRNAMDRFLGRPVGGVFSNEPRFKSTIKKKNQAKQEDSNSQHGVKDMVSFDEITEATDALVARGMESILNDTREVIQRRLYDISMEYKWESAQDEQVYGPFSFKALIDWQAQGIFKANPIFARQAGSNATWDRFPP